jgi:dTDP-4-dehydrorhamnose reductase
MNCRSGISPELWGGIECTIHRLQENYIDQLELGGVYRDSSYLDSIIGLGIKRMRFPILWEKHQPKLGATIEWTWASECLEKLRKHHIVPIAGLLHHGSGPSYTGLLDENFPQLFAAYAANVAGRFPWIENYTPINEPLTTARFSGLYGLWFPHKKNDATFIKMLLNELKASVLAMKEIRKINPAAKFVQTEDLGKTYSTPILSYQADFENERRWLTYDLLRGNFDSSNPLWDYMVRLGIDIGKLQFFSQNPCPPDIIGANHYVTSERYLDENISHFPVSSVGGNGLHRYADVEAARAHLAVPHGLSHLLNELWQRYRIPIAITEVHLNCTREEQLRWLADIYSIIIAERKQGVNVLAITCWALLGSFGWDKLLTKRPFEYESGAFDISAGYSRPTALVKMIKSFNQQESFGKNLTSLQGWWQRDSRYYKEEADRTKVEDSRSVQPVIIIGKTGALGQAFATSCTQRNIRHCLLSCTEANICDEKTLVETIDTYQPWAIINAGYFEANAEESNNEFCYRENFLGAKKLAELCSKRKIKLMTFSSDLVFDGQKGSFYIETDITHPRNAYGHSVQLAEIATTVGCPSALVIRTMALFGFSHKNNFTEYLLNQVGMGSRFEAQNDIFISPTYVPHLVRSSLDLLIDNASGIFHLVNQGCVSWYEFAKKIVQRTDLDLDLIIPFFSGRINKTQPTFHGLTSIRYGLMPSLEQALDAYSWSAKPSYTFTTQHVTNERI